MHITMSDMMPVSLCLATHELFDASRFRKNFCDYTLLRSRSSGMEDLIWPIKKELGASEYQRKYIEGHKAIIISNIDKILALATTRYAALNLRSMEALVNDGKILMKKVMQANEFSDITMLEPTFKSKILLPVYELFLESTKRTMQSGPR